MTDTTLDLAELPLLLTIPQTAEQLGYKTTAPVYRMIARGELPVVKIPAGSRIKTAELIAYIERNSRGA